MFNIDTREMQVKPTVDATISYSVRYYNFKKVKISVD